MDDPSTSACTSELLRVFRKYLSLAKMGGRLQVRGNRNIENHTRLEKIAYEVKSKLSFFRRFLAEMNSRDTGVQGEPAATCSIIILTR